MFSQNPRGMTKVPVVGTDHYFTSAVKNSRKRLCHAEAEMCKTLKET